MTLVNWRSDSYYVWNDDSVGQNSERGGDLKDNTLYYLEND